MLCENQDRNCLVHAKHYAIEHLKHQKHNPNYLSSVAFNTNKLKLTNDINFRAVAYTDYLILYSICFFEVKELENLTESLKKNKFIFFLLSKELFLNRV